MSNSSVPQTPEAYGHYLFSTMRDRSVGYRDLSAEMIMNIYDRRERHYRRQVTMNMLEGRDGEDKTLIRFIAPVDQKGVSLLTHSHRDRADDRWLYLPAVKRVKRIALKGQSSPFMGSDFTYEDLATFEVSDYRYRYLQQQSFLGITASVVEQIPAFEHSGYSRRVVWIDDHSRILRIEYYDHLSRHKKTLLLSDYQLFHDRYWYAGKMVMHDHLRKSRTELIWSNYDIGSGLKESLFSKMHLRR